MEKPLAQPDFESLFVSASSLARAGVAHGFFKRGGGVSAGVYASLNCGAGSSDNLANVAQNRALVAAEMGVQASRLIGLHQTHSDICHVVGADWDSSQRPEGDGFVTDVPGFALGVLTADCAPVLFLGEKADGSPVIGAAHAGWGGAFKGVLGCTVEKMLGLGARLESIHAAVGPCIAQKSYEVGQEFIEKFIDQDEENERFFKSGMRDAHYMFDLSGYCAARLATAGVKSVAITDIDTYTNEADFFSYRRATHRAEEDYGRQISVICIAAR